MKRFRFKTGLIFASWALMLAFGCPKKKPPVPPQEQAPTISKAEQPPPPVAPPNPEPENPPATQEQPPESKPEEKPAPPKRTKPRPAKKVEPDKPVEIAKNGTPPDAPAPPRVVIQEAPSGQNTGTAGSDNQNTTQQLLDTTDNNVRSIEKRQLSANELSELAQIKDYVSQSRQAIKDGDLVRAHNLAIKAHLLSDDLAKSK